MICLFFKCSFVLKVGAVKFELDKVSMSNIVKLEFWSMTLKIEGVFEKTNKILSQKLAIMAMNLVSKKDQNQCKFLNWGKNTFFCKIKSLYIINNLCVVIKIIASYFPMVWKWCPEILFLHLNLTMLHTLKYIILIKCLINALLIHYKNSKINYALHFLELLHK